METKPVITCLKTLLIVYSFVFWVRILSVSVFLYCTIMCFFIVVRDEGVDSGSIIDGIMLLCDYNAK